MSSLVCFDVILHLTGCTVGVYFPPPRNLPGVRIDRVETAAGIQGPSCSSFLDPTRVMIVVSSSP